METDGPDGKTDPFSRSNGPHSSWSGQANQPIYKVKWSPEQVNPPFSRFFVCYIVYGFLVILNSNVIFVENFHGRSLKPYLLSQLVSTGKLAHFKSQTIPKVVHEFLVIQNSNMIFAKKFHGRPLKPHLWSHFIPTGKSTHFQGQKRPRASKPPVFLISHVHSLWIFGDLEFRILEFLVIQNSDVIFAEFFHGRPLRSSSLS
ncbi:hypothetical protein H5410_042207 [Solanum commersonii]|uniref:Uncharacterized protein n=1 Tax=Solanum commersonii TaxID=4109 RepID=A0A9J5XV29_SOLCO|nr:hypothetical protein H5410_042207 [Solanum commersonii]